MAAFALLALVPPTRAQQRTPDITILHTAAGQPQPSGLPLSLFFALRDEDGDIVSRSALSLDGAQGELTVKPAGGEAFPPVPITVDTPTTPIRIALVIDRSGSMNRTVPDAGGAGQQSLDSIVRAAAVESIKSAPDQAEFAVFSFAERPEQQSDGFLRKADQSQLIEDAIRRFTTNPSNTGNTCISDAALQAIEALNAAGDNGGVERKAVILFTDGLDKEADTPNGPNNCSNADFGSVVRSAQLSSGTIIPIYTIWPCTEPCDQNQRIGLENLARETRGASAIGSLQEVDTLFQRVMELLNSQWVITAPVLANQGDNTATLEIRLDSGVTLTAAAPFISPVTILPAPEIEVAQFQPIEGKDGYKVAIAVTNAGGVGRVVAGIYDNDTGGSLVGQEQTFEAPGPRIDFEMPTTGMAAGQSYYLRVSGTDREQRPLRDARGETLRIVYPFTYQPKLSYTIGAIAPEYDAARLTVAVDVRGAGERDLSFRGDIINRADGNSEPLEITTLREGKLRFPLPAMLRDASEPREYELVLRLEDGDREIVQRTERPVTLSPPSAPPGLPVVPIALGVLAAVLSISAIAVLIMRARPRRREIPLPFNPATVVRQEPGPARPPQRADAAPAPPSDAPRGAAPRQGRPPTGGVQVGAARPRPAPAPPVEPPHQALPTVMASSEPTQVAGAAGGTVLHDEAAARRPRVRIKVIRTLDLTQVREQVVELPCTLGREYADFVIASDSKISRRHAQIKADGDRVIVEDCGSTNGTWLNSQELRGASAPLDGRATVRLGPNTAIEVEVVP